MDFSSASSSSFAANNGTESLAANKEQIMQQVKTEMALAEAQTLLAVSWLEFMINNWRRSYLTANQSEMFSQMRR